MTYKEFAYLIWGLDDKGKTYTDAIRELEVYRKSGLMVDLPEEAKKYTDAKPIMILERWGFLSEDDSESSPKRIVINDYVLRKYHDRLKSLKIYNVDKCENKNYGVTKKNEKEDKMDMNKNSKQQVCLEVKRVPRIKKMYPLNFIVYGAPGTGKTYAMAEYALAILEDKSIDDIRKSYADRNQLMTKYNSCIKNAQIVFTTFHQSYGYEEFIQGLRPDTESDHLAFKKAEGVFKQIADNALMDTSGKKYVIIIDEINRANISKVFGELITLIEEDKRWGEVNQTCVTLQSGDVFAVPNNLYIIGTMNSADKSISLIDAALRRRFEFIEQYPDESLVDDATLKTVLKSINGKLADDLESSDLLIGHSYFMNKSEDDLCDILNRSVIPLLYEYYYDDKRKVNATLSVALKNLGYNIVDEKTRRIYVEKKGETKT